MIFVSSPLYIPSTPAVCGLLMPNAHRDAYFALRAFNVELASIKDGHNLRNQQPQQTANSESNVPDSSLALQLRMQWWRDAVGEILGDSSTKNSGSIHASLSISYWNSPVLRALDRANAHCRFTGRFLERMIDARELDLDTHQYATLNEVTAYAEHTVSSLLYLTLEACGVREDAADACAAQAGVGIGLATALRATPYRLATGGEVPIPAELLRPGFPYHQLVSQYLVTKDDDEQRDDRVLEASDAQLWRTAVEEMAAQSLDHLLRAREQQSQIPKAARATLLPVVPALHYLERLERADYNVFDPKLLSKSDRLRLLWLLGRTWMTGVF